MSDMELVGDKLLLSKLNLAEHTLDRSKELSLQLLGDINDAQEAIKEGKQSMLDINPGNDEDIRIPLDDLKQRELEDLYNLGEGGILGFPSESQRLPMDMRLDELPHSTEFIPPPPPPKISAFLERNEKGEFKLIPKPTPKAAGGDMNIDFGGGYKRKSRKYKKRKSKKIRKSKRRIRKSKRRSRKNN